MYLRILSCVHASLHQDGFYRRGLWVVVSVDITPPLTFKEPFCSCAFGERLLTLRMKNMWPLIFDLGRAQPPPLLIQPFLSWDFGPQVKDFQLLYPMGPTEKSLTTHSGILAWRIPWTEDPGGLYIP